MFFGRNILETQITNSLTDDATLRPAIRATIGIGTQLLTEVAGAVVFVGVILVICAWFAGPARLPRICREAIAPFLRENPWGTFAITLGLLALLFIWDPIPATGKPAGIITFTVLGAARDGDPDPPDRPRVSGGASRVPRATRSGPGWPTCAGTGRSAGLRRRPRRRRPPNSSRNWPSCATTGLSRPMSTKRRRRSCSMVAKRSVGVGSAIVALSVAAVLLAACGSSKPSYCSSLSSLKSSVKALPTTNVVSGGTNALKSAVTKVQNDANAVISGAKSDFPNETSALTELGQHPGHVRQGARERSVSGGHRTDSQRRLRRLDRGPELLERDLVEVQLTGLVQIPVCATTRPESTASRSAW